MAGGQERALKRRIKSVQSTKKITKAMELISASRIAKAQERVAAARPYSERITEVIRNLAAAGAGGDSPLLNPRDEITTVAYVVVAADRGLAGGYNSAVIRGAERAMAADKAAGRQTALITVGKKATGYFRFRGLRDRRELHRASATTPSYEDARAGGRPRGRALRVRRVLRGPPRLHPVPLHGQPGGRRSCSTCRSTPPPSRTPRPPGPSADYEFEPSPVGDPRAPAAPLRRGPALRRHARRRRLRARRSPAGHEVGHRERRGDDRPLSRVMNRARQDAITTEIMEIVGGAEALRQSHPTAATSSSTRSTSTTSSTRTHVSPHRTDHFSSGEQS